MLNPDGVYRGHYRMNLFNVDLNTVYHHPDPKMHEGPYAAVQIAHSIKDRLYFYIDFHSHAVKNSGFLFSNFPDEWEKKTEIRLFGRLMDIYSPFFNYNDCGFTKPAKGNPGVAKSTIGRITGCLHCYTFETSYFTSTKDPYRYDPMHNPKHEMYRVVKSRLGLQEFYQLGDAVRHTLAEMLGLHPHSILNQTLFGNKEGLKKWIDSDLKKKLKIKEEEKEDKPDSHIQIINK